MRQSPEDLNNLNGGHIFKQHIDKDNPRYEFDRNPNRLTPRDRDLTFEIKPMSLKGHFFQQQTILITQTNTLHESNQI
jgi:hypothetical protein